MKPALIASLMFAAVAMPAVAFAQAPRRWRPRPTAWGIARDARLDVDLSSLAPSDAVIGPPHGPRTRVEFVSEGAPQTVSLLVGQVERGGARFTATDNVYREICTTPCSRVFREGSYDLRTTGPGIATGLHSYRIADHPVRFHLRTRPAWAAGVGGASLAVGIIATLVSIGLLANGSIMNTDLTPGWIVLGGGAAFGVLATGLLAWSQSTGASRVEPIP